MERLQNKLDLLAAPLMQIEKVSGKAFLECASDAWRQNMILVIEPSDNLNLPVDSHCEVASGGGWYDGSFELDDSPEIAQISSTSGTTGPPKAIAISRAAISDTVRRLIDAMEMDSSIREYIAVPVTYSFGLGRVRAVTAVGGKCFLPEGEFRPDEIAQMLADGEINALSAVPTMLRVIIANPKMFRKAGERLRWLEIGSQHMTAKEKRKIRNIFPNSLILQHYGLTEASRTTFLRIDLADNDELESVGHYIGDTGMVRIASDDRIEIKGNHLATGMIREGKLQPIANPDGWLRTADLGAIRNGSVYFLGRADDVANIGGIKISAEHFEEQVAKTISSDAQVFACILDDNLRGNKLGIAYRDVDREKVFSAAKRVAAQHGLGPADLVMAVVDPVPRTETGKLRRDALAKKIVEAHSEQNPESLIGLHSDLTPKEAEIVAIWQDALGVMNIRAQDNFHELGGDSLSAVSVMIKAEQLGLPPEIIQRMFAGETVAQIANGLENGGKVATRRDLRAIRADSLNAVRGLLALLIVISHWGPFFAERMGIFGAIIWSFVAPFLRIGTPGFAIVYGMGLGLFFFGQIDNGNAVLKKRIRKNMLLISSGVLLMALAVAWSLQVSGTGFGPIWPEQLFYEVLLFYALMVPTSLFWLRIVARTNNHVRTSLLLAAGSYAAYAFFSWLWPVNQWIGWLSLGWHMLVAPYAYPRLLAAVFIGLAAILWLQRFDSREEVRSAAMKMGLALGIAGFVIVAIFPGDLVANAGTLIAIPAFVGLTLILYAVSVRFAASDRPPNVLKFLIICGMIAFPIFIGHGLVFPLKTVLESYGVQSLFASLIPAITFVAAMVWLGWRLYLLVFGQRTSPRIKID